jgi:hypothetical protein
LSNSSQDRAVDRLAADLCDAAERLVRSAPVAVTGADWDPIDEDPLAESAWYVEALRRWEATGEHPFTGLRPGLEPHLALADGLARSITALLRDWEREGQPIDPHAKGELEAVARKYWEARQIEGGPGLINVDRWQR